jgi:thioesterase domain-containing protein
MVQDALISYGVLSPMTAHTEMTGLLDVFTRNFLAGKNYIASPNNQQVVFFRASETPEHLAEPWTTLAVGGIHFHSVPGDHFTILTQPTVRIIADLLQEYVLKAYEQPLQAFSSKCGNEALIIQKGEEILG